MATETRRVGGNVRENRNRKLIVASDSVEAGVTEGCRFHELDNCHRCILYHITCDVENA